MISPRRLEVPNGRVFLRVAEPESADPLDPGFAAAAGGCWNPPASFPTLYLNGDGATAGLQLQRLVQGAPFTAEDLADDAYVLLAATLPRSQSCADAAWSRSATGDDKGRELAWFPATARSRARLVWTEAKPLGEWRDATGWHDLGLADQPDPEPLATNA